MKLEIETTKKSITAHKALKSAEKKKKVEIEYKKASYSTRFMSGLINIISVSLVVYFVFDPVIVLDPINFDDLLLTFKYFILVSFILLFMPEFLFGLTLGTALFRIYLIQEKTNSNPPFYVYAIRFFVLRPFALLTVLTFLSGLKSGDMIYDSMLGTKVVKL
ncbi:MAG: hypothetical protein OHK0056_22880 [Bacteriovoracaceae bacterium]